MRLAVVSSDGENVDLHLGRGKSVFIYDYDDELNFVEQRDIEIADDAKHQGGKVTLKSLTMQSIRAER